MEIELFSSSSSSSFSANDHVVFFSLFSDLDMLARSPKARSRSPHRTNGNTTQNDLNNHDINPTNNNNNNNKSKKENDSQLRMKSLKVQQTSYLI